MDVLHKQKSSQFKKTMDVSSGRKSHHKVTFRIRVAVADKINGVACEGDFIYI